MDHLHVDCQPFVGEEGDVTAGVSAPVAVVDVSVEMHIVRSLR